MYRDLDIMDKNFFWWYINGDGQENQKTKNYLRAQKKNFIGPNKFPDSQ